MNEEPKPDNIIESLLKEPERVANRIAADAHPLQTGFKLLAAAVACHALFGLAMGFFGGWQVAWMDAIKAPLIALCSLLLCYPSLYVFSSVGGAPLTLAQAFKLGASCLAMLGILLIGLAPIVWLFAVSTANPAFMTILVFCVWVIALVFVVRYMDKLQLHALFQHAGGLKMWLVVLVIVTLQMTTCMRPLLAPPGEAGWWTSQKQFFLQHFGSTFHSD